VLLLLSYYCYLEKEKKVIYIFICLLFIFLNIFLLLIVLLFLLSRTRLGVDNVKVKENSEAITNLKFWLSDWRREKQRNWKQR